MYKARSLILTICIAAILGIITLTYIYPALAYFNCALVLVILLTIFLKENVYTVVFGLISVVMIFTSLILTEQGPQKETIVLQVLAAIVAFLTIGVVLRIKTLNHFLERERIQMNAVLEHATEGIVLTNSHGKIILVNPEAQRLFEYDRNELLDKPIGGLIPEGFEIFRMKSLFENSDTVDLPREQGKSFYAVKKSGEEFPVEVSVSHCHQKQRSFSVIFIVDISQRKFSENKLIEQKKELEKTAFEIHQMNAELESKVGERTLILQEALQELERSQTGLSEALNKEIQLNEIKSRFVSMASHEFRTPLSIILSSAALVSKYTLTDDQEKREKHIRRIRESVKHLNVLLEDFLSLGKLEEGRVNPTAEVFDLNEFLQDVIEQMNPSLKPGQHFELLFDGESYFVTDKRLLKNVLINLLSNSIKFSDEGKPISIRAKNSPLKLLIEVKDEGMGIARDDMPFMFTSFYRGKNASNIQGTGLGLHIIKRYVDLLEGQITLSSELNQGTTFSMNLPSLQELVPV